jgi:photosystem II stability/assembly factor-like uncharacterized protein
MSLKNEPMLAITYAGSRLVGAGSRGIIMFSDDSGNDWKQAFVPVQSDLTDIQFSDARNGWACGHDGVILHSSDGGASWTRQIDGNTARGLFEAYYSQQISQGNKNLLSDLQQIQLNYDSGPWLPWLGIWFNNARTGYAVGSFGDIAATHDGGRSWQPWLDHIDNPQFLDLDAIREVGGQLYIVGEQGSVYQFDDVAQKFIARPTGYSGSLFGLTGTARMLIVFGLRGTIFRSLDQGRTWSQASSNSGSTLVNGWTLPDGRIMLVSVDGTLLTSIDDGKSFYVLPNTQNMVLTDGLNIGGGKVVLTGLDGTYSISQK